VANLVGEFTGANRRGARAAQRAALAQQAEARRQQELALSLAESPQELAALGRSLDTQEKSLARQEKLIAAIDPVTLEASQQALGLLRGEESRALDPIRKQRKRQRQQLINSLREQMGPGAESSSAGLQALQNFDIQTSQQIEGSQQGTLSQLFGIAQGGQDSRLAGQAQGFGQIAGGFGNIAQRKVGAALGTGGAIIGSAGAQFTGDALRAQQIRGIGGELLQAGTTIGAAFAGGAGGFGGGGGGGAGGGGQAMASGGSNFNELGFNPSFTPNSLNAFLGGSGRNTG
jgi:hypothetical protein